MEKTDLLRKNIIEFYTEGNSALKRGSYNTAVSLFFKTIAVLVDYHILKKEGFVPKNHAERFRLLQQKYMKLYEILDKDFPVYQDSYDIILSKEMAGEIKDDVKKVAEEIGFKLD